MGKFTGITFPFYAISEIPDVITYSLYGIDIVMKDTRYYIVDDRTYPQQTYIGRLLAMDADNKNRLKFKYTCTNLQQLMLLMYKIKWGVDNTGKIFDLSKKEKFLQKITSKIVQLPEEETPGLLRLKGISYPFEVPFEIEKSISAYALVCLAKIEERWYIHRVTNRWVTAKTVSL